MKAVGQFVVVAATLIVLAHQLPGFHVSGWAPAILAAVVLGAANAILKPILFLFTLPFTILTLGLFLIVLNAMMLWLTQWLVPGFSIHGVGPLLLGTIVISLVSTIWSKIVPDGRREDRER